MLYLDFKKHRNNWWPATGGNDQISTKGDKVFYIILFMRRSRRGCCDELQTTPAVKRVIIFHPGIKNIYVLQCKYYIHYLLPRNNDTPLEDTYISGFMPTSLQQRWQHTPC